MFPKTLLPDSHTLLKTPTEDFDFSSDVDTNDLAQHLVDTMREHGGIGLAANQIGLPYRVFAMEGEPALVMFNPRIVMYGEEIVLLEEMCLTFPGLSVKIKRPKTIKVRFEGPDGQTYTKTFSGLSARVFQHELDHLDGIVFHTRANTYHKKLAMNSWKKLKRKT